MISVDGASIDVKSYTYDPETGTVTVDIDYTSDIQGQ
jgi:hypothetical protein